MDGLRAHARELLKRAGLGDAPPGTVAIGVAVAVVVLAVALWQWWPGRESGAVVMAASQESVEQGDQPAASATNPAEPSGDSAGGDTPAVDAPASQAGPLVHVVGAVRRPGVYSLSPGARVADAVSAAGGLLGSAAQASVNLARVVSDGEQIYVPTQDEAAKAPGTSGGASGAQTGASATGGSAVAGGGAASGAAAPVNLNTADAALLDTLPGVGPSTAAKIVAEREANGPFKSVDELARVSGIGPKKLDALKGLVVAQ